MKKKTIRLQQVLHGYDEGHRLLAASCRLSTESQQILIEQSDLSGASSVEGFSTYLSAFPLLEEGYYCISRTWEAPEMERPGCVWTHSLLVPFSDLPNLDTAAALRLPHAKPSKRKSFSKYETSIELSTVAEFESLSENQLTIAALIAESWGEHPGSTLYIPAATSSQFEAAVVLMWCGQWPKLRRTFAFSTGSLRDRKGTGFDFDLQVFPESELSLFKRSIRKKGYFFQPQIFDGRRHDQWLIGRAFRLLPNSESVYDFLFKYGADIFDPKSALKGLCSIYELLAEKKHQIEKIFAIARSSFPSAEDGFRLKADLLSIPNLFFDGRDQLVILKLLREGEIGPQFPFDVAGIPERVAVLWPDFADELLNEAVSVMSKRPTPLGSVFLEAISENVRVSDIEGLRKAAPDSWMFFVARKRDLTLASACLKVSDREKLGLLVALKNFHADGDSIFIDLIVSLLDGDSAQLAEYVYRELVVSLNNAYGIWFNKKLRKSNSLPSLFASWRRALKMAAKAEVERESSNLSGVAELVSSFLYFSVRDRDWSTILTSEWESAYKLVYESADSVSKQECMCLLVGIGLSKRGRVPVGVLLGSAKFVHLTLAQNEYSERAWQLIEPWMPRLDFWQEWDRCEKLRAAMGEYAMEEFSSFEKLAKTSKKKKIKTWVADYIQQID